MAKNIKGLRAQTESRRATLGLGSRGAYSVESLESGQFTPQEIRREYSRLRSIAKKRFERLAASEFGTGAGKTPYNFTIENYPTLREIKSERELVLKLRDLASVIESPRSTVYGLRDIQKASVKTIQEAGYSWVNESNWQAFGEFMGDVRAMTTARLFDSERAVNIYNLQQRGLASSEEVRGIFQAYLESTNKLVDNIPEVKR